MIPQVLTKVEGWGYMNVAKNVIWAVLGIGLDWSCNRNGFSLVFRWFFRGVAFALVSRWLLRREPVCVYAHVLEVVHRDGRVCVRVCMCACVRAHVHMCVFISSSQSL